MKKMRTQPRIKGIIRLPKHASFHPDVKYGLESIGRFENKSVSWVIAQIVSEFFNINCETGKLIRGK